MFVCFVFGRQTAWLLCLLFCGRHFGLAILGSVCWQACGLATWVCAWLGYFEVFWLALDYLDGALVTAVDSLLMWVVRM